VAIVAAGAPARDTARASGLEAPVIAVEVDPSTLPAVSVSPDVSALNAEITGGPQGLALMLAENLIIEGEAMLAGDTSQLRAADDGERLVEMERKVEVAATTGELLVSDYRFDALHLDVVFTEDSQDGASLALVASGSVDEIEYDAEGLELARSTRPFDTTFVMRQGLGDRWLIVTELADE
jgi:hypothetical protein